VISAVLTPGKERDHRLIRIIGIGLSFYFIWRSQSSLHDNLSEIAQEMKLEPPLDRPLWKRIKRVFDFSLGDDQVDPNKRLDVQPIWEAYFEQEQFWFRCCRACCYTAIMFFISIFVLCPLFGWPTFPSRSDFAASAYLRTTCLDVGFMLFLTFFVFDATCFCLLFVNKLRRAETWPAETMSVYKGRLRLQAKSVHDWINLEFVAKRTRCVGSLIYYPFVLIALLIVSRSTVFANYAPSPAILIAQGISLCVVFSCAIMLCLAAKTARDVAKQNLTDGVIRAKDGDDNNRCAEQLETLLSRVNQLKEGAFSPFSQQPLVRAVLLPFGTFGWTALIDNGMLPGL
jgi:hypothetical protein